MGNIQIILASVISLSIIGAIAGSALAYASLKFKVETDPRIDEVLKALPNTNCGACGYPGCRPLAEAIVKGSADMSSCRVGGDKVAKAIAAIMGTTSCAVKVKLIARLLCGGGNDKCGKKFEYHGVKRCDAVLLVGGGDKLCDHGCLGYSDCVLTCKYDAMRMGDDGLPVIDPEKCLSCGKCIAACPRKLIQLVPKKAKVLIACSSKDKGAKVRKICTVGCIKCRLCEKKCPTRSISFPEGPAGEVLPVIDHEKCQGIKECVKVCPTKTIIEL